MWCDSFDMDLPRVIPGVTPLLDRARQVRLWTYGGLTLGKLNCPSAWNNHCGTLDMFFGTHSYGFKPPRYQTSQGLFRVSGDEMIRDLWSHSGRVFVDRRFFYDFDTLRPDRQTIMSDLRGWKRDPIKASRCKKRVLGEVATLVTKLWELPQ